MMKHFYASVKDELKVKETCSRNLEFRGYAKFRDKFQDTDTGKPVCQRHNGPLLDGHARIDYSAIPARRAYSLREAFMNMTKQQLISTIIARLEADLSLFTAAAIHAHAAATHEECQPDNKYDTTALEASYLAQGQANRAQEIRQSLEAYRTLEVQEFDGDAPVRLSALVTLEDEEGDERRLFIGPGAGGMKLADAGGEIVVITPASPLGKKLLGLVAGDEVQGMDAGKGTVYTIVAVA